jgi:hypothetical protein
VLGLQAAADAADARVRDAALLRDIGGSAAAPSGGSALGAADLRTRERVARAAAAWEAAEAAAGEAAAGAAGAAADAVVGAAGCARLVEYMRQRKDLHERFEVGGAQPLAAQPSWKAHLRASVLQLDSAHVDGGGGGADGGGAADAAAAAGKRSRRALADDDHAAAAAALGAEPHAGRSADGLVSQYREMLASVNSSRSKIGVMRSHIHNWGVFATQTIAKARARRAARGASGERRARFRRRELSAPCARAPSLPPSHPIPLPSQGEMVVEYAGEIIRQSIGDRREKARARKPEPPPPPPRAVRRRLTARGRSLARPPARRPPSLPPRAGLRAVGHGGRLLHVPRRRRDRRRRDARGQRCALHQPLLRAQLLRDRPRAALAAGRARRQEDRHVCARDHRRGRGGHLRLQVCARRRQGGLPLRRAQLHGADELRPVHRLVRSLQ